MSLILIVDDEPDMRLALSTVLKKEGHSIIEAGDAETALEDLARQPVEMMLLDIRLPGMDGVQMLKKVRQSRTDLPIVMVTGYGSVDTAVKLMQLGANGYLSKPFSNRQLVETVEKILQARRLVSHPLHRALAGKISPAGPGESRKFQAGPKPPLSNLWRSLAAFMVVAATAAGFFAFRAWEAAKPHPVSIPFSNPTALAWEKEQLWAADWVTQAAYRLEPVEDVLRPVLNIPLPNSHVTGMAIANGYVYTCDSWEKTIQKRNKDEQLSLVLEVPSPGSAPSGLFWDGRTLWSCDSAQGRFYQHEPETLVVISSYPSPGRAPIGLVRDEKFLWSADAETRRFYQHRLDEQMTVLSEFELPDLNEGSEPLSAISYHQGHWWVGRDGRNTILRFLPEAFRKKE